MKKIIITIVLFLGLAIPASAFYSDNSLVDLWNSRRDLQKAFPGDPSNNAKLEAWAKKYGWKETPDLCNYYPDKAIVEKIIDNKTNDRIVALEGRIAELTDKINQLSTAGSSGQLTTIIQQAPIEGAWRNCSINASTLGDDGIGLGSVVCEVTKSDWPMFNNGNFKNIKFLTK